MPTSSSSSAGAGARDAGRDAPWARSVSTICSPTVITGFSASIALWNTIEMRCQRSSRSSVLAQRQQVAALEAAPAPPEITAGGGRMRSSAWASVDLPLPDSPATPRISPRSRSNETWSTARTGPRSVT